MVTKQGFSNYIGGSYKRNTRKSVLFFVLISIFCVIFAQEPTTSERTIEASATYGLGTINDVWLSNDATALYTVGGRGIVVWSLKTSIQENTQLPDNTPQLAPPLQSLNEQPLIDSVEVTKDAVTEQLSNEIRLQNPLSTESIIQQPYPTSSSTQCGLGIAVVIDCEQDNHNITDNSGSVSNDAQGQENFEATLEHSESDQSSVEEAFAHETQANETSDEQITESATGGASSENTSGQQSTISDTPTESDEIDHSQPEVDNQQIDTEDNITDSTDTELGDTEANITESGDDENIIDESSGTEPNTDTEQSNSNDLENTEETQNANTEDENKIEDPIVVEQDIDITIVEVLQTPKIIELTSSYSIIKGNQTMIAVAGRTGILIFDQNMLLTQAAPMPIASFNDDAITTLEFLTTGDIVFGTQTGSLGYWQNKNFSGQPIVVPVHNTDVTSLAVSVDGSTLFSGASNGSIIARTLDQTMFTNVLWQQNLDGGKVLGLATDAEGLLVGSEYSGLRRLNQTTNMIDQLAESSGNWQITNGADDTILVFDKNSSILYDLREFEELNQIGLQAGGTELIAVKVASTGYLVSVFDNSKLSLAKLNEIDGSLTHHFAIEGYTSAADALAFDSSSQNIVVGYSDSNIRVFNDAEPNTELFHFKAHDGPVLALDVSSTNRYLASGSEDNTIKLWDMQSLNHASIAKTTFEGHLGNVNDIAFNLSDNQIASVSEDQTVRLWSVPMSDGHLVTSHQQLNGHRFFVTNVAYSPDNQILFSSGWDGIVALWNPTTYESLGYLQAHDTKISGFDVDFEGKQYVTAGVDGMVKIWRTDNGELNASMEEDNVTCVRFAPNGQFIALATESGVIKIIENGGHIKKLEGHTSKITQLIINDTTMFSSSRDGTVKKWRLN